MSGSVRVSWPSDRAGAPGLVERLIGRLATFMVSTRSSAIDLLRRLRAPRGQIDPVLCAPGRARTPIGRLAPVRPEPLPTPPVARSRIRVRGAGGAPTFSTVRVVPEFSPRDYKATFAALQEPSVSKLLDLVPVRLLCADIFDKLAAAWTAGPEAVPRLGILLSFERWVMMRAAASSALQPLAARGVRVEVFYAEQASAGYLGAWFAHGQLVHNVPAAIATLAAHWHPSEGWPLVINTLSRLARAHTSAAELPGLMTQLAALALSCGGAVEAATLSREALYYLPETPSATRCQALRELGTALLCQEQTSAGLAILDQAFTMAARAKAPDVGASALCHSGLCALNHGDYAGAERRFRQAIAMLSTAGRRHLLALADHSLAVALMHLRSPEAEHHAQIALALRPDPDSHLAEEDRLLIAKLGELRGEGARNEQRGDAAAAGDRLGPGGSAPPLASEADM